MLQSFEAFYAEHVVGNTFLDPPAEHTEFDIDRDKLNEWANENKTCIDGVAGYSSLYKEVAQLLVDVIAEHSQYISWGAFQRELYTVFDRFVDLVTQAELTTKYTIMYGEVSRGQVTSMLDFGPARFQLNKNKSFYWLTCVFAKYVRDKHSALESRFVFCTDPSMLTPLLDVAVYIDDASYSGSQMDERIRATHAKAGIQKHIVLIPYLTGHALTRFNKLLKPNEATVEVHYVQSIPTIWEILLKHYSSSVILSEDDQDMLYTNIYDILVKLFPDAKEPHDHIAFVMYANFVMNFEFLNFTANMFPGLPISHVEQNLSLLARQRNMGSVDKNMLDSWYTSLLHPLFHASTYNIRNIAPVYFFHKIADNVSSVPLVYGQGRLLMNCQKEGLSFIHFLNGCQPEPELDGPLSVLETKGSQKNSSCARPFYKREGGTKHKQSLLKQFVKGGFLRKIQKIKYQGRVYTVKRNKKKKEDRYIVVKRQKVALASIKGKYRYV